MVTKKASKKTEEEPRADSGAESESAAPAKDEPQEDRNNFYGRLEGITPREEPGIVLTGGEQFGGKQGFIPAGEAEAAGLSVTGKEAPKGKGK